MDKRLIVLGALLFALCSCDKSTSEQVPTSTTPQKVVRKKARRAVPKRAVTKPKTVIDLTASLDLSVLGRWWPKNSTSAQIRSFEEQQLKAVAALKDKQITVCGTVQDVFRAFRNARAGQRADGLYDITLVPHTYGVVVRTDATALDLTKGDRIIAVGVVQRALCTPQGRRGSYAVYGEVAAYKARAKGSIHIIADSISKIK